MVGFGVSRNHQAPDLLWSIKCVDSLRCFISRNKEHEILHQLKVRSGSLFIPFSLRV
jgi:hypothetical protein